MNYTCHLKRTNCILVCELSEYRSPGIEAPVYLCLGFTFATPSTALVNST